jgi:hypothetical protein
MMAQTRTADLEATATPVAALLEFRTVTVDALLVSCPYCEKCTRLLSLRICAQAALQSAQVPQSVK